MQETSNCITISSQEQVNLSLFLMHHLRSICAKNMTLCCAQHVSCVPVIRVAKISRECESQNVCVIIQKGYFLHMLSKVVGKLPPSGNHQCANDGSINRAFWALIMCPEHLIFNCTLPQMKSITPAESFFFFFFKIP